MSTAIYQGVVSSLLQHAKKKPKNTQEIKADAEFRVLLGIDSMTMIAIACRLEETLGTNIGALADEIADIATVEELVNAVTRHTP